MTLARNNQGYIRLSDIFADRRESRAIKVFTSRHFF
jgi:hypothetical protein